MLFQPWTVSNENPPSTPARVQFQLNQQRLELDATDAAGTPFEHCAPVRSLPSWRLKRHYSGVLWMSRTGRHVAFESLTERSCLLELDRSEHTAAVASQPMWIRWLAPERAAHAPDYFVRTANGNSMLIDVRPLDRIDDHARKQFDRTAILCAQLGWHYSVYPGRSKTGDANLRFLSRYRDPRWASETKHLPATARITIASAAAALDEDGLGLGRCYWLMWNGILDFDIDQPITLATSLAPRVLR